MLSFILKDRFKIRNFFISIKRKVIFLFCKIFKIYPISKPYLSGDTFRSFATIVYSGYEINLVKSEIIFVQTDLLKNFQKHLKKIKRDFILISSNGDDLVDKKWEDLWSFRMKNYLSDVETFKYKDNRVLEIGKKPLSKEDIQGQYVGVLKLNRKFLIKVLNEYLYWVSLAKNKNQKKERKNIFMTDFLQHLIYKGTTIYPLFINGGWLEVDTVEDLKKYENSWGNNVLFSDLSYDN